MSNSKKKSLSGNAVQKNPGKEQSASSCLLYTSDAADERSSVDLGGRRIIQKKDITQLNNPQRDTEKENRSG